MLPDKKNDAHGRLRRESYVTALTPDDEVDVTLLIGPGVIVRFSINYRTFDDIWHEVYRVDNHHGFVHEQRLWRDNVPRPVPADEQNVDSAVLIGMVLRRIKREYQSYKTWFRDAQQRKQ